MAAKTVKYDESNIKTLSSLEHIRLRTGMYIGRLGSGHNPDDGIYILLKEVVDNSVDEFIMGNGKRISIRIDNGKVAVRDYGRGIPLGKVIDCVSIINTGGKFNDDVFQFSVGLNGVGTKAVNALSSQFRVVSYREKKYFEAIFEKGQLKHKSEGEARREPDGTLVEFIPDQSVFGEYSYNMEFVEKRMRHYAYLNSGLILELNGQEFSSESGLLDLLKDETGSDVLYEVGYWRGEQIEFSFTHTNNYGEEYFSFVNGQYTSDGGTHLSAFREGFLKAINEFFQGSFKGEDIREGIAAAVAIKLKNPMFESQTKNKLGNNDIKPWIMQEVKRGVDNYLRRNPVAARLLQDKIIQNEKLRTELNVVKKEAREAAKKIERKIPKLKDCKRHLGDGPEGENTMIFLTEGQSAAGSMVSARDVYTQAIFSLRGKPENMHAMRRTAIYKNEEMYNMMMALGIENDIEGLRYDKIVIATDADYDGFHIRILLLTFFLTFFEELVTKKHVFILETPLFRVRNKKETRYCYTPKERDEAQAALGSSAEVTRFKGLGEISPNEFGQFIGENIRLVSVDVQTLKGVPEILNFYMGANTPTRREFIMDNLINDL
ncbi:MAG: type IIA DNA topoisomerase subunit B [Spirochaetes bacterium]|nr:type IIA DNA topoisomerase subunit B [Spirochaetota bacterium]MBU0954424.1 type IIA DNA topoisomerase subunit B [Spirochaetota bacterium]